MSSGIKLDCDAKKLTLHNFGSKDHQFLAVKLVLANKNLEVAIKTTIPRKGSNFADVCKLFDKTPGWVIFSADAESDQERLHSDVGLISWIPEETQVKQRMITASTTATVAAKISIKFKIEITDNAEVYPKALAHKIIEKLDAKLWDQDYKICGCTKEEVEALDDEYNCHEGAH